MKLYIYDKKAKEIKYSGNTLKKLAKGKKLFWLDIEAPDKKIMGEVARIFGIHPLVVEDILHERVKPKLEEYDKHLFMVTYGVDSKNGLRINELDLVVGKNYVITCHKESMKSISRMTGERLSHLMARGSDFLAHGILDAESDATTMVLDDITESIEKMEDDVIKDNDGEALPHIMKMKRTLLKIRRVLVPQRDVIAHVTKYDVPLIGDECVLYFRDLYDHLILTLDLVDNQREFLNNILEVHLSIISNKMNEVMKVLTIIATIMLPVTAIGSVYGMNFKYMPELSHPQGYFIVLGVMAAITIGMLVYFRRQKWI